MKNLVSVFVIIMAVAAGAEDLSPIKVGDKLTLRVSGYTQFVASESWTEVMIEDEIVTLRQRDAQLNTGRLLLQLDGEKTGLFVELDLVAVGEVDQNWLRRAYLHHQVGDNWQIRVGRFLKAAGYATPPPFLLETVTYPVAVPFGLNAWGVQLDGKNDHWQFIADITGPGTPSFNDKDAFHGLEASLRLTRLFKETGDLSATVEGSSNWLRAGFDGTWKARENFYLRGGVFYERNRSVRESNFLGAYALAVYRPEQWFEFHSQIDHSRDLQKSYHEWIWSETENGMSVERTRFNTSDAARTTWTNGIRLFSPAERWTVTADWETFLDGPREDTFRLRAQFKF